MKITKKSLIVVAVVLALAVMATPVIASSILELQRSTFDVAFNITPTCQVVTKEFSTKHILFGRPVASTNVGTATATHPTDPDASGVCTQVTVPGVPTPITINYGDTVPFAVVDIRNPWSDIVIKTYAMVAYVPSGGFLGLPVPSDAPVQAGAYARLVKFRPPLKYIGYVYVYTGPGKEDYLTVPFVAEGHPDTGFVVKVLSPEGLNKLPR